MKSINNITTYMSLDILEKYLKNRFKHDKDAAIIGIDNLNNLYPLYSIFIAKSNKSILDSNIIIPDSYENKFLMYLGSNKNNIALLEFSSKFKSSMMTISKDYIYLSNDYIEFEYPNNNYHVFEKIGYDQNLINMFIK